MNYLEQLSEEQTGIKKLSISQLEKLAEEIRSCIIQTVAKNGGHLSSNLGVVELTLALHYIFKIPPDKIIWDVGHQCYPHKLLTGRYKNFSSLRKRGGISGFPAPEESKTDIFHTGHAGTAISSSTGLKIGQDFSKNNSKIIAVIGDGSLTNGLTFEGLNFLGSSRKNLLLILNDNRMSISSTKGALSYYLTRLITSPLLSKPREEFIEILKKIPSIGTDIVKFAERLEKKAKYLIVPGVFFEKLGIRYFGPIDGHDLKQLIEILSNLQNIKEPVVLHIITKKGKGYKFAETNPTDFHGAGKFDVKTGKFLKEEKITPSIFAGKLIEKTGEKVKNLAIITAAMEKGLGLENFAEKFPDRFFDAGIAESHAVVLASGLAKAGMKVIVAIYSTFLQRAYDQIFHDICLQNLPVTFLIDRSGIVGEDGPTHHGIFDISYLRSFPNMKIFAPYSLKNLEEIFCRCLEGKTPTAVRYPRSYLPERLPCCFSEKKEGAIAILGTGSTAEACYKACEILQREKFDINGFAVDNIKPISDKITKEIVPNYNCLITVEEHSIIGGFGSAVLENVNDKQLSGKILRIGLPDSFIEHGDKQFLLEKYGLTGEKIAKKVKEFIKKE